MTVVQEFDASSNHAILSVLVQNKPGVLARVASLFARRSYNIFSLAVAPAKDEGMSRITICVDLDSAPLEQMVKQLFKLVHVVKISELDPANSVERELLLATVKADADRRSSVIELAGVFGAKVLSVGAMSVAVSLEGEPDKLDEFQDLLTEHGLESLQRTGRIALTKSARAVR